MATERLPMRQIREILRLKWTLQRSHRETARSVGVSAGSVAAVVSRATHQGLTWEAVTALTDDQLEHRLWGPKLPLTATRTLPDPVHIHTELRGKGVTLELLHLEYLADHPDARWRTRRPASRHPTPGPPRGGHPTPGFRAHPPALPRCGCSVRGKRMAEMCEAKGRRSANFSEWQRCRPTTGEFQRMAEMMGGFVQPSGASRFFLRLV
jgi:hypothetical protein